MSEIRAQTGSDVLPSEISNYPLAEQTRAFLRTRTFGHVIGAEMRQSATGETLPDLRPASGLQFARVALASRAEVGIAAVQSRVSPSMTGTLAQTGTHTARALSA